MNKFKFIAEEKLQKPRKIKKKKADVADVQEKSEVEELACSRCGETNTTVSMRADPYQAELNDDYTEMLLCDACHDDLAGDV
jgi:hypothetical protein